MSLTDWEALDAIDLADGVRTKKWSALEITQAQLARIAQLEPRLQAYVTVTTERALEQAREIDRIVSSGGEPGPLAGVPLAVKDIYDIAGLATTAGMSIHRDSIADRDATVVERLREAGSVMLGKLTLTEGVYAEHQPPFPAPINPWHADYWSGASSTGSGVAVASGLCRAALGSETGGSIKLPAAANGVTAIKPTWGRVSRHGVFELAATLDHVGPLARSVRDAAALLQVIAGPDPRDPTAAQAPVADYLGALDRGVDKLRIGIDPAWIADGVDAETSAALDQAVGALTDLGASTREVVVPDVSAMIWDWFPICAVQTARAHAATFPSRRDEYGPALTQLLDMGNALSGIEYQQLLLRRQEFRGRLEAMFVDVDVLAIPVLAFPVPSLERIANIDDDLIAGLHRFTCPFNLSGNPGVVLPCGTNTAGLPIVFQLVGRHFEEDRLIAAGSAYQSATQWHRRRPVD